MSKQNSRIICSSCNTQTPAVTPITSITSFVEPMKYHKITMNSKFIIEAALTKGITPMFEIPLLMQLETVKVHGGSDTQ